ncbi:MAG: LPS export ABC transporter permease LptG [Gammaproteobacteria bacterium]|nr:LPS export ABC transporter permease LptG [Gammaproteobacteria bacterium]MBP6051161.1 LPS export ABC transporter permease LptG [Pseudomonadales bacterium]MBK7520449.1 LPS export ABC transporter permease LptG [Gammaproteobacteria bacterium]MBK7728066.1 LPS export ABC transporter permease LptG [Gammaproteobacteria bacterium]MBK9667320.1 LPS export ABC transporter permease LptG [Gammaproteobacteria bacterium]
MIIRRFLAGHLLRGWLVVFTVLTSLFALLALVDEVDNLNERYTFLNALSYIALTTPQRILELSPVVAALGTILAFAGLTRTSELVVIRAAGFSMRQLVLLCTPPTMLLALFLGLSSEFLVASMHQAGETQRTVLRSGNFDLLAGQGLWSSSGTRLFNVRNLRVGQIPEGISLYQFDAHGALVTAIDAARAEPMKDRNWKLIDVRRKDWIDGKVSTTSLAELELGPFWSASELPVLGQSLAAMSPSALYEYSGYLEQSGQEYQRVRMAFWQKIALPVSAVAMVLLTTVIGLGFGTMRSSAFGFRVLGGAVLGVGFYLLTQIFHTGGQLLGLDQSVVVLIPICLAVLLAGLVAVVTRGPR